MTDGSPLSSSVIPTGALSVMSLQPTLGNDWCLRAPTESHDEIKSHFSFDSSAYEVSTTDTEPDDDTDQRPQSAQEATKPWPSQAGFSHDTRYSMRAPDMSVIPARPILHVTSLSGDISAYPFYSSATHDLEKKSQALANEEEAYLATLDIRIYSCVALLCGLNFFHGMNLTSLATVLPTLAYDLNITAVQSFWLVNITLLSATIAQPLVMRLSAAMGSKVVLSTSLVLWAIGSILTALAGPLTVILLGRAIIGIGAGSVGVLVPMVLRQILTQARPFADRSVSLSFWVGTFLGPIIAASLSKPTLWRYLFYLNLPICLVALIGLHTLLRLPCVDLSLWRGVLRFDYIGWLLLSGSTTSLCLALTWAGVQYAWTSTQVLVPLVFAAVCFGGWLLRSLYAGDPILLMSIFRKRTGFVACVGSLVHGIIFTALVYFGSLFYYISDNAHPMLSALMLSAFTLAVAVTSLSGSISSATFHRWSILCSWATVAASVSLLLLARQSTVRALVIPISVVIGTALGALAGSLYTTMQSTSTNDHETIYAAPLSVFYHTLGGTLGLATGGCVFLNRLGQAMRSIPALMNDTGAFTLDATRIAYTSTHLSAEQAALKAPLVAAYTEALHSVWILLAALAGVAFLLSTYSFLPSSTRRRHNDQEHNHSDPL